MIQIRYGTFETNSSSTHSLTLRPNYSLEPNYLRVFKDGYIHVELGEFGWEIENYTDQYHKLSYLLTMIQYFNGLNTYWTNSREERDQEIRALMLTEDFQRINEAVAAYAGCEGIIIDPSEGYIDHQSVECSSLDEFLPTDILDFIFGAIVVHTDNDNH